MFARIRQAGRAAIALVAAATALSLPTVAHAQPSSPSPAPATAIANTARVAPARPAPAQGPRTEVGADGVRRYWMADLYLCGGFNQLTLALLGGFRHRWDSPRVDNLLLDNRRLELGVEFNLNPGFLSAGAYVEWTPLQILVLRAQTDVYGHWGIYGAIKRYETASAREDWSDNARELCQGCRPGFVQRALGRVVLQAQLGPIAVRSQTDVGFYALHGDEPNFILIEHDILAARREVIVLEDAQLLVEPYRRPDKTGLFIGPMYSFARTLFAGVQRQRISLFGEWVFHRRLGPFARPRAIGFAGYHLEDRNRGGGFIGVIGLGSEFDL